jgi:hypothetical protein
VPTRAAKRTQAEWTEATTTALVDAARELFACETAMIVARADDQKAAHRKAVAEIDRIMDGLVAG